MARRIIITTALSGLSPSEYGASERRGHTHARARARPTRRVEYTTQYDASTVFSRLVNNTY